MQELIAKLLAFRVYRFRDSAAYERLYDEYVKRIRWAIARKIGRAEDVDELTAEVFLRGWEYMTANKVDHPRALLNKIAQNLVAGFYKKPTKTVELDDELADTIAAPGSLINEIQLNEEVAALLATIDTLREEYKEVLLMHSVEQQSIDEIAEVLGKSTGNIRVILFRARRALKKKL